VKLKIKNKRKFSDKRVRDIKKLSIPNICFSLADPNDTREPELARQRITRGFDDSETWSLSDTIANFILPRLERFIELEKIFLKRDSKWDYDLQNILSALKLVVRDSGSRIYSEPELKIINTGLNAFKRRFMQLWW